MPGATLTSGEHDTVWFYDKAPLPASRSTLAALATLIDPANEIPVEEFEGLFGFEGATRQKNFYGMRGITRAARSTSLEGSITVPNVRSADLPNRVTAGMATQIVEMGGLVENDVISVARLRTNTEITRTSGVISNTSIVALANATADIVETRVIGVTAPGGPEDDTQLVVRLATSLWITLDSAN